MIGHHDLNEKFIQILKKGWNISSSLFYGPPSVGKRTSAFEIAKAILCLDNGYLKECACKSCLKFNNDHPDFLCIGRTSGIGVSEIDKLIPFVSTTPFLSKKKIVVLDNASRISNEAANRLLKIIEKPPPMVVFFLVTSEPEKLLPTIKSRCVFFEFGSLSHTDRTEIFWKKMGFDLPVARTLGWIACGSSADVFSDPGAYLRNRDSALELLHALKSKDPLDALDFVDRIDRTDMSIFIDMIMMILTDMMTIVGGSDEIINSDIREDIEEMAKELNGKILAIISNFIVQSKRGVLVNANMAMALKNAILKSHPYMIMESFNAL